MGLSAVAGVGWGSRRNGSAGVEGSGSGMEGLASVFFIRTVLQACGSDRLLNMACHPIPMRLSPFVLDALPVFGARSPLCRASRSNVPVRSRNAHMSVAKQARPSHRPVRPSRKNGAGGCPRPGHDSRITSAEMGWRAASRLARDAWERSKGQGRCFGPRHRMKED
jgi:hypothetical protein